MPEQFLYEQLNAVSSMGFLKKEVLQSLVDNLNPQFELRPYQIEAFARFIHCYHNDFPGKTFPLHVLFNMATGSGKTLAVLMILNLSILFPAKTGLLSIPFTAPVRKKLSSACWTDICKGYKPNTSKFTCPSMKDTSPSIILLMGKPFNRTLSFSCAKKTENFSPTNSSSSRKAGISRSMTVGKKRF
jgi:hypothetical protein